jgi:hypothetical protein
MSDEIRVFIGSATEDLPIVDVIAESLRNIAKASVTPWTEDKFRKPGRYFLDDLIKATSTFDFAVLIFGPSDETLSRGERQRAPRDNVVFELGLFMSQIDRDRSFVVAPRTWKTNLKILSDLKGFNLIEYDLPLPLPRAKEQKRAIIGRAIEEQVCGRINDQVLEMGIRRVVRGPKSVNAVSGTIDNFIRGLNLPPSSYRKIQNLALDMEHTWSLLYSYVLDPDVTDVEVEALMIDHESEAIRNVASRSVSVAMAAEREQDIIDHCRREAKSLAERRVRFECRAYSDVPTFHGFLFNEKSLLISFCDIKDGRLEAKQTPYLQLDQPAAMSRDHTAYFFISVFRNWFAHRWNTARKIWPER